MKQIILAILCMGIWGLKAQNNPSATITGSVTDDTQHPLEFASVMLLSSIDSTLKKGAMTSADGKFVLDHLAPGHYLLCYSMTGFGKSWSGSFVLAEGENKTVPVLVLTTSVGLKTVQIETIQSLFVQEPGKLVMNIENSAVKMGGTVYDALIKAPGVSIDPDGIVSMKGKSGVQIYLDGKPTYLSADQLRDYLMSMSAGEVVRIELMTTPPAKYNAEGSAGIINIVTQKTHKPGLQGSATAGMGQGNTTRAEGGASLSYGNSKFRIYGQYNDATISRQETKRVMRTVSFGPHTTSFDQQVDLGFQPRSQTGKAGLDFFPDSMTTIGLRGDASLFTRTTRLDSRTTIEKMDSGTSSILHQVNTTDSRFLKGSLSLFASRKLDTTGTEINISLDYVNYQNRDNELYNLYFLTASGMPSGSPAFQRSFPNTDIGIYAGQIDYSHPFRRKYKLETGLKSSLVQTNNNLLFENQDGSGQWQKDLSRTNTFLYTEQINAAYLSLTADWGKWNLQGGLRAEQTISDGNSSSTGQDHRNNTIQLFPSLLVSQKISENHSMQYTFFRRINRPAYDELNPFYFYLDRYLYRIGNPFLQPEITNGGDATYSYKNMFFASAGASHTTSGIAHITRLADSTGVLNQTSVNMNTIDNMFVSLTLSNSIVKWWSSTINATANYNHYMTSLSDGGLDRANIVYNMNVTETFLLKAGIKAELSGWYQSPMVYSIFLIQPSADVSLGLSRSFLKDKLKLSINVSDLFLTRAQHVTVDFQDQHLVSAYNFDSRYVYVRLKYNFDGNRSMRKAQFHSATDDLQKRVG
jgi:hypothetical protein